MSKLWIAFAPVFALLLVASSMAVGGAAAASKPMTLAGIFPGAITDKSWNESGYTALIAAGKKTHSKTAYAENVGPSDQVADFKSFAAKGYDIVYGHGGQYQAAALQVAPSYPKVHFVVITATQGNKTNVSAYGMNFAQFAYVEAFVAGKLTKSHHLCGIAGLQGLAPITQHVGGWVLGAKAANRHNKFTVVYLSSMEDVASAHSAATTLASKGCDVIFTDLNAGVTGAVQGAAAAGAWTTGLGGTDATKLSPKHVLTNVIEDWSQAYLAAAVKQQHGQLHGGVTNFGYDTAPYTVGSLEYSAGHQFNPRVPHKYVKMANNIEHRMATKKLVLHVTAKDAAPGQH